MKLRKETLLAGLVMLFLGLFQLPVQAYNLNVSGQVTDITTGSPIPNHTVYISLDSSGPNPYNSTVVTDGAGNYFDNINVTGTGNGQVYTFDCQNAFQGQAFQYSPNTTQIAVNFSICSTPTGGCQANFSSSQTSGNSFSFTSTSSGTGSNTTYYWDFGDGNTSTLQNPSHSYNTNGTFSVCLTISDAFLGCQDTYCSNVTAQVSGGCQAYFTSSSTSGNSFAFQNASSGTTAFTNYYWDFGDGNNSYQQNPSHTYANSGVYMICLTISDSNSTCQDTYCDSLFVQGSSGSVCDADFSWSYSGSSVVFNDASTSSPSTIISWSWNFGDGNTSTIQNPTHTYASGGLYTVCLDIFTSDSCSSSQCYQLQANGGGLLCNASFTIVPDSSNPNNYLIYNTSTGTNLSYFWDFGDGNTSTLPQPTNTYATAGSYTICLTINDSTPNGTCTSTYCDYIQIGSGGTVTVLSPLTSIQQGMPISPVDFNLFPNPASAKVHLSLDLQQNMELSFELIDLNGRKVKSISGNAYNSGKHVIDMDVSALPTGLYFGRVQAGDYTVIKKLMISK